jgi:hypothetical protein
MRIANLYSPRVAGEHSAEEVIFRRGLGDLYSELREVILTTHLEITNTPQVNKKVQIVGLSDALNKALGASLHSLGWQPEIAPGTEKPQGTSDFVKLRPSGLSFMGDIGLAVEVQFGNNYQFNADVQRLSEAILQGKVVAGISIVASDELARYKADRGTSFSNAKDKLERWLRIWAGSGAILLPSIMIIGIEYDKFLDSAEPQFFLKSPIYDLPKTNNELKPIDWKELGPSGSASEDKTKD